MTIYDGWFQPIKSNPMTEKHISAWEDVVLNLAGSILGSPDSKRKVISKWLDEIRDTPEAELTDDIVRKFL